MTEQLFNAAMALALLALGWRALATRDLFRGVVLFIVFGLVMAVAWARLAAPDVALAEAAVGAGITGALLLDTLGRVDNPRIEGPPTAGKEHNEADET